MSRLHFFTGENSITQIQQPDFAYGEISNIGNQERYNLENKFSVASNAPVYAMVKSLVLMVTNEADSNLLNVALLPIDNNYMAGYPVKFIIYRGIAKSAIINTSGNIVQSDSSWEEDNILKIIHNLQDKINQDTGTTDEPDFNCLGVQFDGFQNETLIESILSDETDDFHPLIVPSGCQIGKFAGGSELAGIEIVLDKIGKETTLEVLKADTHILEVPELVVNPSLPEREKIKLQFKDRIAREEILAYIDVTALYGSFENQGLKIIGVSNNTNYLSNFLNKNSIYIDIRDERGFSYNHFLRVEDEIQVGFYDANDNVVYTGETYYNPWPVLKLSNLDYNTSKEFFYIKIPMIIGTPENALVLTSFTKKVSVGNESRDIRYKLLNPIDRNGNIKLNETEPIKLRNWVELNSNKLGCNYFLLKIDRIAPVDGDDVLSPVWNSFFSTKMNPIFGITNIDEGELRIKTYSAINAPLLTTSSSDQIFYPTIGIAADKYHITFFAFYREGSYNPYKEDRNYPLKMMETTKFKYAFSTDELDYQNPDQAVGFLYYLTKNDKIKDYRLSQYAFNDTDNGLNQAKFVKFLKDGAVADSDLFFRNFQAITFTHGEYEALMDFYDTPPTDNDYIAEHPLYVRSKNVKLYDYEKFSYLENIATLGIAKIEGDDTTEKYQVSLVEHPNDVIVNGEQVVFTSMVSN